MHGDELEIRFVEFIPDSIEINTLYVSMNYATVVHRCCCGCGCEVVTPLSPKDWKITFDGVQISLYPSIGNWGFSCQSHYWIRENRVLWAESWSQNQVDFNRAHDRLTRERWLVKDESVNLDDAHGTSNRRNFKWWGLLVRYCATLLKAKNNRTGGDS